MADGLPFQTLKGHLLEYDMYIVDLQDVMMCVPETAKFVSQNMFIPLSIYNVWQQNVCSRFAGNVVNVSKCHVCDILSDVGTSFVVYSVDASLKIKQNNNK